ncbi:MAG: hypothetical protein U0903_18125 [Planctomycetales bacterium]
MGGFAAKFLGIMHQGSAEGETDSISVDLSPLAVYEFDVHTGTYEIVALLGPKDVSEALLSQALKGVGSAASAMRGAAEYKAAASSTLRVNFASAFFTGSGNVNAAIG